MIWGARVNDDMKGKISVMTIITGVSSPWIVGKKTEKELIKEKSKLSGELGLNFY